MLHAIISWRQRQQRATSNKQQATSVHRSPIEVKLGLPQKPAPSWATKYFTKDNEGLDTLSVIRYIHQRDTFV